MSSIAPMLWIDTKTEAEAVARSERLWTPVGHDLPDGSFQAAVPGPDSEDGEFWADAIKKVADDPHARLEIARRQLPLPAGFREQAVALRALIRKARKQGADFEPLLRELHHFAAIKSWALSYNEIAQEPGFNVLERTPYAKLAALDLGWDVIGCDELVGLNKTDRALMRQVWGEPRRHTTANAVYHDLWLAGCRKAAAERQRRMKALASEIEALRREERPAMVASQPPRRSLLARLFGG